MASFLAYLGIALGIVLSFMLFVISYLGHLTESVLFGFFAIILAYVALGASLWRAAKVEKQLRLFEERMEKEVRDMKKSLDSIPKH